MVVERTIMLGFIQNFGTFKRSRYSKIPLRLAIINGFPFNPTYDPYENHHKLGAIFFCVKQKI